jgi:hypothetical protein
MVDTQLACRALRDGPSRYRRRRARDPRPRRLAGRLASDAARAVLIFVEACPVAPVDGGDDEACRELLRLLAVRPATGERFDAAIRPRRPLADLIWYPLELPGERFECGEELEAALDRFDRFVGADGFLAGWGPFGYAAWRQASGRERDFIDVRPLVSRALGRRTGGVEQAEAALGAPPIAPWAAGRGGRRIAALSSVFASLLARP